MKKKIENNISHQPGANHFNLRIKPIMQLIGLICLFSIIFSVTSSYAQTVANGGKVVSGKVTDAKGDVIPGTTVVVKGTSVGTITDQEGEYSIQMPSGSSTLIFSFIGMASQEVAVSSSNKVNIVLKSTDLGLDEVVVVGYGIQKKETATGAISTVKSEEILHTSVSNVGNALVGLVPGVSSVQFGGEPGSNEATIRIRGVSTLNGGGQDALVVIDGIQQDISVLNNMNPNDISSISILKDASATSIYGIRGANGVIIVTTKRGTSGKAKISVTSKYGVTQARQLFTPLSSYEYAQFRNEAILNDGITDGKLWFSDDELWKFQNNRDYTDAELEAMNLTPEQFAAAQASPALYYGSHDYFKEQYGNISPQMQTNLNVSGGNEKVTYFSSVEYFRQDGVIKYDYYDTDINSKYNRFNFRSNVDIKPTDNLTISLNLSARFSNTIGAYLNNQDIEDRYWTLNAPIMGSSPFQGPGIVDGKLVNGFVTTYNPISSEKGAWGGAPINTLYNTGLGEKTTSNAAASLNLKYNLDFVVQGLSVSSVMSYDDTYTKARNISTPVPRYTAMRNPENPAEILFFGGAVGSTNVNDRAGNYKSRKYYVEGRINYDRSFSDHNITAVILGNAQKMTNPYLLYHVPEGLMGIAARATYNYKEKYLAEVNMAYNGSENFPEKSRFGFFPSFSTGWVISEESFLKDNKILSWLKIRGSLGLVGNDKIGGQRFLYLPSTWANYGDWSTIYQGYFFGETNGSNVSTYYPGAYEDKLGNPDVTWEKALKRNIALETRFFEDKLSLTTELYDEKRTDILWPLGIVPHIAGASFPAANIGEVYNKGYEIELQWRDQVGAINYYVKGYIAYSKNKVVYKDEAPYEYDWMNETGYSIGQYKGYRNVGFYNNDAEANNRPYSNVDGNHVQPGDLRYIDINGDGILDASDRVPIGYSNLPLYSFSTTVGASYKGFDVSLLFTGSAKGSISLNSENMTTPFFLDNGIAYDWQYEGHWTPELVEQGITPTFPRAGFNNNTRNNGSSNSDFWLLSNNYLKLKNIEVAYSLDRLASRLNVGKIRISLDANNVWLIKSSTVGGIDPEQLEAGFSQRGFIFPMTSAYMAGIKIEF
ncbi:MAG: SusC/RagA family TonB-linked outer membrane protein [Prolixibacteraceae bacterium]